MKVSPVDLNLLAVLDAIVQTRSVSRAAQRAGISKPAMSHALSRLRAQMNDPVLVRKGQDWQLTERALGTRERVRELVEAAHAVLDSEPVFDPLTTTREFTINATDHALALVGIAIGNVVASEAPRATLTFVSSGADDVELLRSGQVDIALGVFSDLAPELMTQTLFPERFASVVRIGHPRVNGSISRDCFLAMKHVVVAPRGRVESVLNDVLFAGKVRVTRFVPYFLVALDLVSRSDYVVTLSERLAQAYAERFRLQVLPAPIPLPTYSTCQVWHPRADADPAHRWLRRRVADVAARIVNETNHSDDSPALSNRRPGEDRDHRP
jgi:DNA-binding transcriptional LysR family regulator